MARLLQQLPFVQAAFQDRIHQKIQANKATVKDSVATSIPILGGFLAPIAGAVFDMRQGINERKGERGETHVVHQLLSYLPDSWCVFHNATIEPKPDIFAQIYTLVIGPSGLFLIETKAWQGSYTAYRDEWKRREGRSWTACSSPTKQTQRHAALMTQWLRKHAYGRLPEPMSH